jgi:hypothetical protein
MTRRAAPDAPPAPEDATPGPAIAESAAPAAGAASALGNLADLPVAGLTRRRIAILLGALVAAWVIVLFARQVGEASDATARAVAMRSSNARMETQAAALQAELTLIQRQAYIEQAARGYRLGSSKEIPFVLAEDAAPLRADAPGSASVRLGTDTRRPSPLDSWSRLLFGSAGAAAYPPIPTAPAESPGSN